MFENVIEDCTSALNIEKSYEKALTRRAKAYENVGKLEEAFEDLTSLCILQKFSSSSMAVADRMVKKIGEKMSANIFGVSQIKISFIFTLILF
jgi:import receptor subunit TOM70